MAIFYGFSCFPFRNNPEIWSPTLFLCFFPSLAHFLHESKVLAWCHVTSIEVSLTYLPGMETCPWSVFLGPMAVSTHSRHFATPVLNRLPCSLLVKPQLERCGGQLQLLSYDSKVGMKGRVPRKLFPSKTCPFEGRTSGLRACWNIISEGKFQTPKLSDLNMTND